MKRVIVPSLNWHELWTGRPLRNGLEQVHVFLNYNLLLDRFIILNKLNCKSGQTDFKPA